jgi:hypothetical protein
VINSPEVCFGTTMQHAEVGHKNIIIFGYKNHLGRFCRNGKQFLEKDLQHNFVQFIGTAVSHDITHNISKNWYIPIFSCQKYQESDHVSITKVVGFFTTKPTKLGLHFSVFSTIFY